MRGIIPSQFGTNVRFFIGIVEDRADPQQRGRLRVRVLGVHSEDQSLIPTNSLPWAIPIQSVTSAAIGGVGESPNGAMIGTMVLVTFLDGNDMQIPAVLGTIGPVEGYSRGSSFNDGTISPDGINDISDGMPGNVIFNGSEPPWLSIAKAEVGVKEYAGSQNNPRILEYLKSVGISTGDSTPWCSAFANWCMTKAGQKVTGVSGMARSWSTASGMEKLSEPLHGAIVVLKRPPRPNSGHVGFLTGIQGGSLKLLGGNQSNKVNIAGFSKGSLIGFYWPRGFNKDQYRMSS